MSAPIKGISAPSCPSSLCYCSGLPRLARFHPPRVNELRRPTFVPVVKEERDSFMEMAINYFMEAIPRFEPQEDFKKYFFDGMVKPNICCEWVFCNRTRV